MDTNEQTRPPHHAYPVFLHLENRPCLIVGGGPVAMRKAADLIDAGATVTVVAESPVEEIERLAAGGALILHRRRYRTGDAAGAFIVFAATDDDEANLRISADAREAGALVNAVDNPPGCDFYSCAVVKRGPLRIAVSTTGCAPGIAARIRREIEALYGEEWGVYLDEIGRMRRELIAREDVASEQKHAVLHWLAGDEARELFFTAGKEKVWETIRTNNSF